MELIDLRSDTVTRPTAAMRAAMAAAPVGDDQYGEDPTTNLLQERCAALLGKEAALWLPSGTMANQVALRVLTRPGDEVVTGRESHAGWHETGGAAANAGVQLHEVGDGGLFTRAQFEAAVKPRGLPVFPPTTLVEIENTHNRGGGLVFPQADVLRDLRRGARSAASPASSTAPGCGTPRWPAAWRKRAGRAVRPGRGGLQQGPGRAGRVAAGRQPRADRRRQPPPPHARRRDAPDRLLCRRRAARHRPPPRAAGRRPRPCAPAGRGAGGLRRRCSWTWPRCRPTSSSSACAPGALDAATLVARARERGVLLNAFAERTVRAVTHLDVSRRPGRARRRAAERTAEVN